MRNYANDRLYLISIVIVMVLLLPQTMIGEDTAPMDEIDENKQAVQAYIDAFNDQNPGAFGETLAGDVHIYGLLGSEEVPPLGDVLIVGADNYIAYVSALWAAFPDLYTDVEIMISEGDWVAVRWLATGAHDGEPLFAGISPEGQETAFYANSFFRVENGEVAEKWFRNDDLTWMLQLEAGEPNNNTTAKIPPVSNSTVYGDYQSSQQTKEVLEDYVDAFNSHDAEALRALVADDITAHGLFGSEALPPEGEKIIEGGDVYVGFIEGLWGAFPDVSLTIERLLSEDGMAGVQWSLSGHHTGEPLIPGIEPEGQEVNVWSIGLFSIEDGEISEMWYQADEIGTLRQIGAIGPGIAVTGEIVTSWVETHDTNYVTEDIVFVDMATGDEIAGREDLYNFLEWFWFETFDADIEAVLESAVYTIGDGESAVELTAVGTHVGEFAGVPPTGNEVEFPVLITYEHRSEWPYLIEHANVYIMLNVLMEQIAEEESGSAEKIQGDSRLMSSNEGPGLDTTREIITHWIESPHDTNYVTEDVVFTDMATGDEIVGREELHDFLEWFWGVAIEADWDAMSETINYIIGDGIGISESRGIGIHAGDMPGFPASGNEVDFPMAVVYELDEEPPHLIKNGRPYIMMNILADQITSADSFIAGIPDEYRLRQNYPNPFNPSTTIQFSLPVSGDVQLIVYDVLGREVETLVEGYREAGIHNVVFDAENLSSGVYLYQLRAGEFVETKRFILVK